MSKISATTRDELVKAIGERYRAAPKKTKLRILDEFIAVTGYHRKLRFPDGLGHAFRSHLGTDSGATWAGFRSTWAPFRSTWAAIPGHLGTESAAPGHLTGRRA